MPHVFILSAGPSSPAPPPVLAAGAAREMREVMLRGRSEQGCSLRACIYVCECMYTYASTGVWAEQEAWVHGSKTTSDVTATR